jgi:signal transduction histidine kinase
LFQKKSISIIVSLFVYSLLNAQKPIVLDTIHSYSEVKENVFGCVHLAVTDPQQIKRIDFQPIKDMGGYVRLYAYPAPQWQYYMRLIIQHKDSSMQSCYFNSGIISKIKSFYRQEQGMLVHQTSNVNINTASVVIAQQTKKLNLTNRLVDTFYFEVDFQNNSLLSIEPVIIHENAMSSFVSRDERLGSPFVVYSLVVIGILSMMFIYNFITFYLTKTSGFVYYLLYLLVNLTWFVIMIFGFQFEVFAYYYKSFWLPTLQILSYLFYFLFIIHFLNTKQNANSLHWLMKWGIRIVCIYLVLFACAYLFDGQAHIRNRLFLYVRYVLIVVGFLAIILALRIKHPLIKYMIWGAGLLTFFGLISMLISVFPKPFSSWPVLLGKDTMTWYITGVVLELIFFSIGLGKKTQMDFAQNELLKREAQQKEFEKQLAVLQAQQKERNRIAAELHDDLGGGLSTIRMLSELAKQKMGNEETELEKISHTSKTLVQSMNEIVWSMNNNNDSLESLLGYIRKYVQTFLEDTEMICTVESPESLPNVEVAGAKRREIFLCVKEAVHNIMKHANAKNVRLIFSIAEQVLTVCIADDGIGIPMEKIANSKSGLRNMHARMEAIGGKAIFETKSGTQICFQIALAQLSH